MLSLTDMRASALISKLFDFFKGTKSENSEQTLSFSIFYCSIRSDYENSFWPSENQIDENTVSAIFMIIVYASKR